MNRSMSALLSLLLLPFPGAAELQNVSFSQIRDAARAQAAPAGAPVPVKFVTREGPAADRPPGPPNLNQGHVRALDARLEPLSGSRPLSRYQRSRIVTGMVSIDSYFLKPIPEAQWTAIIRKMGDVAEAELRKPGADWDAAIDQMLKTAVNELKDPHSEYLTAEEHAAEAESTSGSMSGIGVNVKADPLGMRLGLVFSGSPAETAGLLDGDVVAGVDGQSMAGLPLNDVVGRVKGPAGTRVELEIQRDGRRLPAPIVVTRAGFAIPNVFSKFVAPGIAYVYLAVFNETSDTEVLREVRLRRQEGAASVILDVRDNPGGLVPIVSSIASEFLKDGQKIVSFHNKGELEEENVTDGDGEFSDVPVVVLVNGGSASASEILSGALQDHHRGYAVIGTRTYGKNSQQVITDQMSGRGLRITENEWLRPTNRSVGKARDASGAELDGTGGVVPDLDVPVAQADHDRVMAAIQRELNGRYVPAPRPRDAVLEKAIEVLSGRNRG